MSIIELLIVVVIIGILMTVILVAFKPTSQLAKARDARRKSDLQKLKNPMEDYYNDHKCYPSKEALDCHLPESDPGSGLLPYWSKVPCDPNTNDKYVYEFVDCNTYRIYTKLENDADPDIAKVGCSSGCGSGYQYNYGVSSSNVGLEGPGPAEPCEAQWWACVEGSCHTVQESFPGTKYCGDSNCGGGC